MTYSRQRARVEAFFAATMLALVVPLGVEGQRPTARQSATLTGRVIDQASGHPISGVEVGVLGGRRVALTDEEGRFDLGPIPPGDRVLRSRRLGYEERSDSMLIEWNTLLDITVMLSTEPIELDALEVVVRSPVLARSGFYGRQRQGYRGTFMDQAEIRDLNPAAVTDLFRHMPGLHVMYGGVYGGRVYFNQRVTFADEGMPGCVPTIWLDGIRAAIVSFDEMRVDEIEGMEVYTGSGAPGKYNDLCGTVVIWTKVPINR